MEHQEVQFGATHNQDLVWNLNSIAKRELAERFIKLFENRLCVYSESVSQLYTNYELHFPTSADRKMVVLPNPYAFHDTLSGIDPSAVRKTGLCILPGIEGAKANLMLASELEDGSPSSKRMSFKPALAQIISQQRKRGDSFLPVLMKGDLREFDQHTPYIHLHCLKLSKLERLSDFQRKDIQDTITRKLLMLYRQADSLIC